MPHGEERWVEGAQGDRCVESCWLVPGFKALSHLLGTRLELKVLDLFGGVMPFEEEITFLEMRSSFHLEAVTRPLRSHSWNGRKCDDRMLCIEPDEALSAYHSIEE